MIALCTASKLLKSGARMESCRELAMPCTELSDTDSWKDIVRNGKAEVSVKNVRGITILSRLVVKNRAHLSTFVTRKRC